MCRPNETTTASLFENQTTTSQKANSTADNDDDDNRYYYLTPDARKHLKTYQYKGSDNSLLYQYILSPLAAFLVDNAVPRSMAPNTVTSIGLVWMISAYSAYWWYAPGLELVEDAPRWIFLFNGIALLVYQTLDNMDGKQARRTGSSSPLGLLFDHGCDAVNSIFGSANVIIGMGLTLRDDPLQVWFLVFGPFVLFYIATWEQYHTGELIMPILNGPSEGLLGTATLSFLSFAFGSEWWQQTSVCDTISAYTSVMQVKNSDLMSLAIALMMGQEIVLKTVAVTHTYNLPSLEGLVPVLALAVLFGIVGFVDTAIWLSIPRTSLHLAMVLFVEASTDLMLSHVTHQKFKGFRWQMAPLVGIAAGAFVLDPQVVTTAITVYAWTMGIYLVVKSVRIVREICDALEIWCFDIVTPYSRSSSSR
jgi:ethanolaminephosphotransferase